MQQRSVFLDVCFGVSSRHDIINDGDDGIDVEVTDSADTCI